MKIDLIDLLSYKYCLGFDIFVAWFEITVNRDGFVTSRMTMCYDTDNRSCFCYRIYVWEPFCSVLGAPLSIQNIPAEEPICLLKAWMKLHPDL